MDGTTLDTLRIQLDPASQAGLAVALFTIMFSVALGVRKSDFAAIFEKPKIYISGVIAQTIGLPLLTLALVFTLSPPPSIALGMIVVASCPGGNVSNLMAYAGRADVALSIALTATSSIIAAFFTPALILLWSSLYPPTAALLQSIDFNAGTFLIQTTLLLAVPLTAGMACAHFASDIATKIRKPAALFGAGLLAVIVVIGTIDIAPKLLAAFWLIAPPVVIHNACAFFLGASTGRLTKAPVAARRTLTFEVGLQNSGLAIVILISQLEGLGGAAAIAAAWGVWHLVAGGAMVALFRRIDANRSTP